MRDRQDVSTRKAGPLPAASTPVVTAEPDRTVGAAPEGVEGIPGARPGREPARGAARPSAIALALALAGAALAPAAGAAAPPRDSVRVKLTEWRMEVTPATIPSGRVAFRITNAGSIPHGFEIEGHGVEKSVPSLDPGGSAALALVLKPGRYEIYCPIGGGSHRKLGMDAHLIVSAGAVARAAATRVPAPSYGAAARAGHGAREQEGAAAEPEGHGAMERDMAETGGAPSTPRIMEVTGGGAVIQVLPGPFPFADSARAVIERRPTDQREDLEHKAHLGPYSNVVARISGEISLVAMDRGATGDSVSGTARFTTKDGAEWRLVMDRVQTKDIPYNPRFGGVIMGLYYHGASGVHTPLVPTIQSSLALWAYAHLWRNGVPVTDDAMVHIMLLSRTRRDGDFALECWDCSRNPIEELQLQVTPAPGTPPFEAPGGFLFVNWEKSSGRDLAAR